MDLWVCGRRALQTERIASAKARGLVLEHAWPVLQAVRKPVSEEQGGARRMKWSSLWFIRLVQLLCRIDCAGQGQEGRCCPNLGERWWRKEKGLEWGDGSTWQSLWLDGVWARRKRDSIQGGFLNGKGGRRPRILFGSYSVWNILDPYKETRMEK